MDVMNQASSFKQIYVKCRKIFNLVPFVMIYNEKGSNLFSNATTKHHNTSKKTRLQQRHDFCVKNLFPPTAFSKQKKQKMYVQSIVSLNAFSFNL